MRALIGFVVVGTFSLAGCGYPHHAFLDLPVATCLGDLGSTYCRVGFAKWTVAFTISRAIADGIDVYATTTQQNPFSLGVRALLIQDLGPLSVAIDWDDRRLQLTAGLFFGPVRIDWGRTIAREGKPWGTVSASPSQHFTLVIGLERVGERLDFLGGARLFPVSGTWAVSLLICAQELSIALGGFL